MNASKFYTVASSAARGAKRAGIENFRVEHDENNGFYFVDVDVENAAKASAEAAMAQIAANEKIVPVKAERVTYKALAQIAPARSVIENPVDYVWDFVRANPDMPRKEVLTHLVSVGLNLNMCKTQYHRVKSGYVRNPRKKAA